MSPGAEVILAQVRAARAAGIATSYDPNIRPQLAGKAEHARQRVEDFVEAADLVKASDQDLAWLYPNHEPHQVAQRWLALGAKMAVVTLGASGALAVTENWSLRRPALATEVIDTVGAGDAFTAGLLSALVRSQAHRSLQTLDRDEAISCIDTAILVASITCARPGANPPTRAELQTLGLRLPSRERR
jgi:fructokinase